MLKDEAETPFEDCDVETSILAYTELLLLADKYDIDWMRATANLVELVSILPEEHKQSVLKVLRIKTNKTVTMFDAFHAGMAETWDMSVLSRE